MSKRLIAILAFAIGAGAGGTGVYFWQKKKYEGRLKDELAQAQKDSSDYIDQLIESNKELSNTVAQLMNEKKGESVADYYEKHFEKTVDDLEEPDTDEEIEEDYEELNKNVIKKPHFRGDEIINTFERYGGNVSMSSDKSKPYIIPYFDFGTEDHYKLITLRYTSDNVLVDDRTGRTVEDIDSTVGLDNLSHIYEGDDSGDCIHVRNDVRMCDYEILQDERTLDELLKDDEIFRRELEEELRR